MDNMCRGNNGRSFAYTDNDNETQKTENTRPYHETKTCGAEDGKREKPYFAAFYLQCTQP